MGRGIHEKTKIKKDIKYAAKATAAAEAAATEIKYKTLNKYLPERIQEKIIDMLENIDPIETAAIFGTTFVVKYCIDTSEELRGKIEATTGLNLWDLLVSITTPNWGIAKTIQAWLSGETRDKTPEEIEEFAQNYEGFFPDWFDWLIAFGIAFIVVRHGDVIFSQFTSLGSFVGGLMT